MLPELQFLTFLAVVRVTEIIDSIGLVDYSVFFSAPLTARR
jgi:hypothetical protein